jgi:hypothetical protein
VTQPIAEDEVGLPLRPFVRNDVKMMRAKARLRSSNEHVTAFVFRISSIFIAESFEGAPDFVERSSRWCADRDVQDGLGG